MTNRRSFSTRMSNRVIGLTSILFLAALGLTAISAHYLIAEEAKKGSQSLLAATIHRIENKLLTVERTVYSSSWVVLEHRNDPANLYHITQNIVSNNDFIVGSTVAFKPGEFRKKERFAPFSCTTEKNNVIKSIDLSETQDDYTQKEWFRESFLAGHPVWCSPYFDEGGVELMISTYSLPLKDENGSTFAIMTADVSVKQISEILRDINPYRKSRVILMNKDGLIMDRINHTVFDEDMKIGDFSSKQNGNSTNLLEFTKDGEGIKKCFFNGKKSFIVYGTLSNGWTLSIICSFSDVLSAATKMQLWILFISLLGLLVIYIFCRHLIKKTTKPLDELSDAAKHAAKTMAEEKRFDIEIPNIETNDEIGQLSKSFRFMCDSLSENIKERDSMIAAKEKIESELSIAREVQMEMLPTDFPSSEVFDLHAILLSAKEVGGDLYDFVERKNYLSFSVGDVSGKGVPAALVMSKTKSTLLAIGGMGVPGNVIVNKINDSLCHGNKSDMFVTFFVGRIELDTGRLEYCNAGHNPIVIVPPKGKAHFLNEVPNIALGVMEGFPYVMQNIQLDKGTCIILYTDGVTEAENTEKELFGESRLLEWADYYCHDRFKDSEDACNDLVATIRNFTKGNVQNDDITIMIIRY